MPIFSADWFTQHIPNWEKILQDLKGKPNLSFLEIGCYEGMATLWLLENILTAESSHIMVIDPFRQTDGYRRLSEKIYTHNYRETFEANTEPYKNKIIINPSESFPALIKMHPDYEGTFDFIYVDGLHDSSACLADMVLSWDLLKDGGIMICDDYGWDIDAKEEQKPKMGIDGFLLGYTGEYQLLLKDYQVALRKRNDGLRSSRKI
jgi:predicted O-methyltransferase YrrM